MNWFMLSKLAFVKKADPHTELVCPNPECRDEKGNSKSWIADLLWERPELSSYHIMDHGGRQMSRQQFKQDAANAQYESSIEEMACPHCGMKHRIHFKRPVGRHAPSHEFLPPAEQANPAAFKTRDPLVFPI